MLDKQRRGRMKRIFILLVITLIALPVFAAENVLIDFTQLVDDTTVGTGAQARPEHSATIIDFGSQAGASVDPETRELMQTSLFINNWDVDLNSSAQTALSNVNTWVQMAEVRPEAERFGGEAVLGARIVFPSEPYNAWALIKPPFEIPAYGEIDFSGGYGVLRNVGVIKQIGVTVYGLNYPHGLSIIVQDENNEEQEIFIDYLDFDGWRQLIWENPNYIEDVRDRELRQYPLYPHLEPLRKLVGFRIYRDGANVGGDFVVYLHDVVVVYDEARLDIVPDIDHDLYWEIMADREQARRDAEIRRLGNLQVLRSVEAQLQAEEDLTADEQ
jgi:hypothetical protein